MSTLSTDVDPCLGDCPPYGDLSPSSVLIDLSLESLSGGRWVGGCVYVCVVCGPFPARPTSAVPTALSLLDAANRFVLESLRALCEAALARHVTAASAVPLLEAACHRGRCRAIATGPIPREPARVLEILVRVN